MKGLEKQNKVNSATRFTLVAVLILLLFSNGFSQQNLVPNPSFENDTSCSGYQPIIYDAPPWNMIIGGTPDIFDTCLHNNLNNVPGTDFGYHFARTGRVFTGEGVYDPHFFLREYMFTALIDTLRSGYTYCISFYTSRGGNFQYGIDNIQLYVSNIRVDSITDPSDLVYTPQISNLTGNVISDSTNWTRISGTYTALGGEKYITIGNFETDANTHVQSINVRPYDGAYYFIDDVSVVEANASINAGRDTTVCLNNPVILGSPAIDGVEYSWTPSLGLNDPHLAMPVASPTCTTSYILTQTQCNIVKTDTVKVTLKTRGCLVASVPGLLAEPFTVPTIISSGQFFTIQNLPPLTKLDVYDTRGRLVYSKENYDSTMISDELPEGFYFTKLTLNSGFPSVHKLLILH